MKYFSADYRPVQYDNFYDTLKNNLINGLPAILFLTDHAIIADGFNTDGYFHLNFGWCSGNPDYITNTWYKADLLPKNYDGFQRGIINIQPVDFDYHPELISSTDHITFPCVKMGKKSDPETFILKNSGAIPVTIDDILISDNFEMIQAFLNNEAHFNKVILQPDEELKLYVRCLPDTLGPISGQIQMLSSNGHIKKYMSIELTGYGTSFEGTSINTEYVSGIWQENKSPYYICNDICIPADGRLEVQAGTEIIFMGPYQIRIEANTQLVAKGSVSDSIYFYSSATADGWHGFYFNESADDDTLDFCVLTGVDAPWEKTTLCVNESSPVIRHTSIIGNKSAFYAGAVRLYASSASFSNVRLSDNLCTTKSGAGALYLRKSTPVLKNVLICNNQAKNGGAVYAAQSSFSLINLTIVSNKAEETGGALLLSGGNNVKIRNTIIWGNEAGTGSTFAFKKTAGYDTITVTYSDIDTLNKNWLFTGDSTDEEISINWDKGTIFQDPLFSSVYERNYKLHHASPCIDSGDPFDDFSLEPEPNGERINMGAYGGTAQATRTGIPTHVEEDRLTTFFLSQNYPNPFNPLTTINYELPARSAGGPITNYVELSIYNLLGKKVATLVNQKQAAGRYQVQWDGSGFASGVYYYRFSAGSFVETKKLVLLR
jgi:predicted outer membrane repeat protein